MKILLCVLALFLWLSLPVVAELPEEQKETSNDKLGLTSLEIGWYPGLELTVLRGTTLTSDPAGKKTIITLNDDAWALVATLKPNKIWRSGKWVNCSAKLSQRGRVAIVPVGRALELWRGIVWAPIEKVKLGHQIHSSSAPSLDPPLLYRCQY
ncbi:MAG TPA: hypothetical protein VMW25_03275 [Clostridia bacterium]|nr:hypothetical protein [Clostridia bacterium]